MKTTARKRTQWIMARCINIALWAAHQLASRHDLGSIVT